MSEWENRSWIWHLCQSQWCNWDVLHWNPTLGLSMADKELTLLSRIRTWFTIKYTLDWKTAFMSRLKHREISFLHSISDLNVRSSHMLCPFKSRDLPQRKRSVTPEASLVYVFEDRRREKKWMNVLFLCLSILSLTCRGLLYPLSSFPSPGKWDLHLDVQR